LSAAFEFGFEFDFELASELDPSTRIKSGGQECPPHTFFSSA
jgi:hypothetical protein